MTVEDAYQRLGLMPPHKYISKRAEENRKDPACKDISRKIGSTTWMYVSALVKAEHIACTEQLYTILVATRFQKLVTKSVLMELAHRLGLKITSPVQRQDLFWVHCPGGQLCPVVSHLKKTPDTEMIRRVGVSPDIVFDDLGWKEKARDLIPPHLLIRTIIHSDSRQYFAYDGEGRFLFELTEQGMLDVIQEYTDVVVKAPEPSFCLERDC